MITIKKKEKGNKVKKNEEEEKQEEEEEKEKLEEEDEEDKIKNWRMKDGNDESILHVKMKTHSKRQHLTFKGPCRRLPD